MARFSIILMLAVVVAIPAILPADSDAPAQKAFGRYKITGRELYNGDPYEFTGNVRLAKEKITVTIIYNNDDRARLHFEGLFETELTETLFKELEVNGTIRRKFVLRSKAEAAGDDDDIILKSDGWVKIRKTQDETFEFTLHYTFGIEGARFLGGGKGQQG